MGQTANLGYDEGLAESLVSLVARENGPRSRVVSPMAFSAVGRSLGQLMGLTEHIGLALHLAKVFMRALRRLPKPISGGSGC